ncbi:MAG: response regulator transcription factor [Bacteroidota bacterium]
MNKKIKLLLVEDESTLAFIVKESLETRDFEVIHAKDGVEGWSMFQKQSPDVCVLDVMMPEKDGFSLAKEIRAANSIIPIIFLTAKSQTRDVVRGFEIGANDYIKKPFSMEELIVRVKALLRHQTVQQQHQTQQKKTWSIGDFQFDCIKQTLRSSQEVRKLTHREAEILHLLCQHQNQVLERKTVLLQLWGDDTFFNARSMDVFITKLRKYFKTDPKVEIVNVRGIGYKLIG